jgi:hypothetical protein
MCFSGFVECCCEYASAVTSQAERAYPNTQIVLCALQREHGLNPSHLFFLNRHLSQAVNVRLRMPWLPLLGKILEGG